MHTASTVPSIAAFGIHPAAAHAHPFETTDMRQVRKQYETLRQQYRNMRVKAIAQAYTKELEHEKEADQEDETDEGEEDEDEYPTTSAMEGQRMSSSAQRSFSSVNANGHERATSRSRAVSQQLDAKGRSTTEEKTAHKEQVDGKVTVDRKTHTRKGPDGKVVDLLAALAATPGTTSPKAKQSVRASSSARKRSASQQSTKRTRSSSKGQKEKERTVKKAVVVARKPKKTTTQKKTQPKRDSSSAKGSK